MKKKRLAAIGIIAGILVMGIVALGIVAARKSLTFSVGRCLIANNGSYMLIKDNSPIVMSNWSGNEELFAGLESGDKILVLHDGIQESYPGGTGAYAVQRLEKGDISDISDSVLEQLTEMGWLGAGKQKISKEEDGGAAVNSQVRGSDTQYQVRDFEAQYIRTNVYYEGIQYPVVKVIRSVEELSAYYEENKETYDLERKEEVYSDTTIGFLDACDKYDAAYFEKQILILVLLEEGSGSIRHEVTGVETTDINGEQGVIIRIETEVPEVVTDDMAEWHILVEPEAGVDVSEESNVIVYLDGVVYPGVCGLPKAPANENGGGSTSKSSTPADGAEAEVVSCSYGDISLSVNIPEGWEYNIEEYTEESNSFGISFWPAGETVGELRFRYYESWGVCGTGLSEEIISIGGYEAYKGTYDNAKVWDFISLKDTEGSFVIINYAKEWLGKYMEEAMGIINTIRISDEVTE